MITSVVAMKAILLAGGKGTRLRPLTIHTPKPIVPIFDRPFLQFQLDLIKKVAEIDEVILSLNYQPRRIEEIFGDGGDTGLSLRYMVEPAPLGTGGAIKFAAANVHDSIVVFNGDVLTEVDLGAVIALHRERKAKATIVLTPVDNPSAYGLVETDPHGNIQRFLEKPDAQQITCNTINAGIYVLEPDTFDRIPPDVPYSIERSYFPSLIERGETFVAYIYRGYWIDIGTTEKYMQVHRDIMDRRYHAAPFSDGQNGCGVACVSPKARVEDGAIVEGPCFIDADAVVKTGARVGPYSVVGRHCYIEEHASVERAIIWADTRVSQEAIVRDSVLGRSCHVGRCAIVDNGAVVGDKSVLTDYSKL
jgi:NDP-sugar pyrophosphorylase family protein